MLLELDSAGMYDTAAEEIDIVFVSSEFGGGITTRRSVDIARRGVRNFLIRAGILDGESTNEPTIDIDMPDHRCYVMSYSDGLVEFCMDLSESVSEGDVVARVHETSRTGRAPTEYHAAIDGVLVGRTSPAPPTWATALP